MEKEGGGWRVEGGLGEGETESGNDCGEKDIDGGQHGGVEKGVGGAVSREECL